LFDLTDILGNFDKKNEIKENKDTFSAKIHGTSQSKECRDIICNENVEKSKKN